MSHLFFEKKLYELFGQPVIKQLAQSKYSRNSCCVND